MHNGLSTAFQARLIKQGVAKLKIRVWREIQILNQFQKIANFKRDYLDNGSDSEFTVKTKNAPFFMNFPNMYKLWQISLI